MKAAVYDRYGSPDVVRVEEVDMPALQPGTVLVRVRGTAVNPYDWHFVRGEPYLMRLQSGLRAPKRTSLGADFAGTVEGVAGDVADLRPGDEVYGFVDGAFAEYLRAPASEIARKPRTLGFDLAAAVPLAGLTALQSVRDLGHVQPGDRVLVIGASGGVGTFAVQIAKAFGADVTGVCSTANLDLVRSLGADRVIDYTTQDFASEGATYDVVLQLSGADSPSHCRRALTPTGRLVLTSGDAEGKVIGPLGRILSAVALSPFVGQSLVPLGVKRRAEDLKTLADLIDDGKVKPVIDRTYPLDDVAEAIGYVERGHSRGKVLIRLPGETDAAGDDEP